MVTKASTYCHLSSIQSRHSFATTPEHNVPAKDALGALHKSLLSTAFCQKECPHGILANHSYAV